MCRWLLELELELIKPKLIVAMGATAAQALTGDGSGIASRRGAVNAYGNGGTLLITYHPSAILRASTEHQVLALKKHFFADVVLAITSVALPGVPIHP
jgi:DNA polymerase